MVFDADMNKAAADAGETLTENARLRAENVKLREALRERSIDAHLAWAMLDAVYRDNSLWVKTHLGTNWEDCTDEDCRSDRQRTQEEK